MVFLQKKEFGVRNIIGAIVIFGIVVLVGSSMNYGIKDKPRVTYQTKVTDWNEVYNNGFKVVKREGNITTLEKENE